MKTKVALLINADPNVAYAALEASRRTELGLRTASTSREAFKILGDGLNNIAVIIIDLDPGIHGMALLNALEVCNSSIPILTLTGLDEDYVRPIVRRRGARDCIGKPLTAERLTEAILACIGEAENVNLPA